jgi:hypothetical protein
VVGLGFDPKERDRGPVRPLTEERGKAGRVRGAASTERIEREREEVTGR